MNSTCPLPPIPFGTPLDLTCYQSESGYSLVGQATYIFIPSPMTNEVIYNPTTGPISIDFTNDIPNHRLLWHYGPNQGFQYSDEFGSRITYTDTTTTSLCFKSNVTWTSYINYFKLLTATNAPLDPLESPLSSFNYRMSYTLYSGVFKDPSVCNGLVGGNWILNALGKPITYYFSTIFDTIQSGGISMSTATNYQYHFTHLQPINTSEAYWSLPSNCLDGSPYLFELCPTTLPNGWATVMLSFQPYGYYQ